ncbi:MAG TPA: phosphoribosylglycinamide formyltransferase [Bacillota bacterium]|nr:phosphoribosylglycinamide formyltransferase [Bacillota bacterium]HNT02815.1 phosphoribosylglycinamide formyltransferase [Bacillota bacterium]HPA54986.1 phosphoribosylglycinamide formyltransferase [Bacillota bacterium]HPX69744.1 phosphoribosylglycinamide formyltransferase [Bacillota bacterium]HQA64345.1 phosphoribosylglycinamide formyltransferase [Bacillota bacterium]
MRKVRIAVLVSGGGTNLQTLIDAVDKGDINGEIAAVISDNENAYALERARKHGIKAIYINRKLLAERLMAELQKLDIELVVLAGFLSILDRELVKAYEGRIINIHPSLIPSFCGKGFYGERVHKAALEYGVKVSGATVHFVDEGTDSGPIIFQEAVPVYFEDTSETLAARVLQVEHRLLPAAVGLFCEGRLRIEGRKVKILKEEV